MQWPPDYIIHSCNPWTDPDVLPPPYNKPVVEDGDCSQIVMGYEDLVFDINPPVFKKNLRKWTVLDGCIYNPNDWDPVGIWEHTQVIKIVPEYPPLIWCPNDTIVTADGDCSGGYVNLLPATGSSDCGADVIITNHSPYAILGGADASGHYTLGFVPVKAEFTGLSEFNMPGLTEDYFGMHEISHGRISSVWFDTEPPTAARSFFTLNFRALESLDTESLLELNTRSTQALAYNSDRIEHNVSLNQVVNALIPDNESTMETFIVGNNYPNPFANETIIPVQLSEGSMTITVDVFSASGVLCIALNR